MLASGRPERFVDFDPLDPALAQDLWERSQRLREECPVARSESYGGFWVLSQYADVFEAAKSWQSYTTTGGAAPVRFENDLFDMVPLETDPPFHREVRTLLSPFFTAEAIGKLEPAIDATVRDLLEPCLSGEPVDFISAFSGVLPATVIFQTHFKQDAEQIDAVLRVLHQLFASPQEAPTIVPELLGWCAGLLAGARAAEDRESLLGVIAHAEQAGESALTDKIRTEIVWQLMMAGLDTTTAGLANLIVRMADPAIRAALVDAPREALDTAVNEFLRFEAPVPTGGRTATRDLEVQGCPIGRGDYVLLNWASANRDDRFFDEPDVLDLERDNAARHLSFGAGVHRCLGRHLAMAELRSVIRALAELSVLDVVTDDLVYRAGFVRGPEQLMVRAHR